MICQRCLVRLARRTFTSSASRSGSTLSQPAQRIITRSFTQNAVRNATPVTAETTTTTNPRPHNAAPAATSTSAAQPFSTPGSPAPRNIPDLPIHPEQTKQPVARAPSSVPAGTVLKGLNFLKNASDPVAKADEEYPAWLWTVLDRRAGSDGDAKGGSESDGDLFSKSKKLRRRAAKALRRAALQNPEALVPRVPVQQQSVDLAAGDGSAAGARAAGLARQRLTQAMRDQRRKGIKEDNFLREMR